MNAIRAGAVVGVGGAVCLCPEVCEECGQPAVHFEGIGQAERARAIGLCESCAAYQSAYRGWLATLAPADRREWERITGWAYADSPAEVRDQLAEFERRHGAPSR